MTSIPAISAAQVPAGASAPSEPFVTHQTYGSSPRLWSCSTRSACPSFFERVRNANDALFSFGNHRIMVLPSGEGFLLTRTTQSWTAIALKVAILAAFLYIGPVGAAVLVGAALISRAARSDLDVVKLNSQAKELLRALKPKPPEELSSFLALLEDSRAQRALQEMGRGLRGALLTDEQSVSYQEKWKFLELARSAATSQDRTAVITYALNRCQETPDLSSYLLHALFTKAPIFKGCNHTATYRNFMQWAEAHEWEALLPPERSAEARQFLYMALEECMKSYPIAAIYHFFQACKTETSDNDAPYRDAPCQDSLGRCLQEAAKTQLEIGRRSLGRDAGSAEEHYVAQLMLSPKELFYTKRALLGEATQDENVAMNVIPKEIQTLICAAVGSYYAGGGTLPLVVDMGNRNGSYVNDVTKFHLIKALLQVNPKVYVQVAPLDDLRSAYIGTREKLQEKYAHQPRDIQERFANVPCAKVVTDPAQEARILVTDDWEFQWSDEAGGRALAAEFS